MLWTTSRDQVEQSVHDPHRTWDRQRARVLNARADGSLAKTARGLVPLVHGIHGSDGNHGRSECHAQKVAQLEGSGA